MYMFFLASFHPSDHADGFLPFRRLDDPHAAIRMPPRGRRGQWTRGRRGVARDSQAAKKTPRGSTTPSVCRGDAMEVDASVWRLMQESLMPWIGVLKGR